MQEGVVEHEKSFSAVFVFEDWKVNGKRWLRQKGNQEKLHNEYIYSYRLYAKSANISIMISDLFNFLQQDRRPSLLLLP